MKKFYLILVSIVVFISCKDKKNSPDVSDIKVDLSVKRFDQDFFSIDTNNMEKGLATLQTKYPGFLPIFLNNITGVENIEGVKAYYRLYKPIFDSSQKIYKNIEPIKEQVEKAFRYVKYYFPAYKTPSTLVPIIGPMNSRDDLARMASGEYTPDFIGPDMLGISVQFYLGKNFSLYNDEYFVNNVAPLYRSRRFSKEYITADVMKLITDDIFPDNSSRMPLLEQMIEKGKQWWLLDKFLPGMPDSVKTGYTQQQLDWCRENEGFIWTTITKQENLESNDPGTIQTYIGEAPFTQGFSQEVSPGNIGPWFGWQILKKFEQANQSMKPEEIMKTPARKILEQAKYKPK